MNIFKNQQPLKFNFNEELDKEIISPFGFREYDARWLFPDDVNQRGLEIFGFSLGTYVSNLIKPGATIVIGHDYRSYSEEVKYHVAKGLITAGCKVIDIGLALSPMVYFAQHHLNTDALAMITASHNDNGWTGIKCGIEKSLTFGPDEINEIKKITLSTNNFHAKQNGSYEFKDNLRQAYLEYLTQGYKVKSKLKIVAACGNGTAGAFAPDVLRAIGCEVVELHCRLDHSFPNYNPNPEDMVMLEDMVTAVKNHHADAAFGFDGDGDRLGVVDNAGEEIFSDKIGLMLARNIAKDFPNSTFVIDVKSTGLYFRDEYLQEQKCSIEMWKTGHSHIKRRVRELNAISGFEKSGHFFINEPLGLGFDDGLKSAILMAKLLDDNNIHKLSELKSQLPLTFQSPTMAPFCADNEKYQLVDDIAQSILAKFKNNEKILDENIKNVLTVNGVRFELENGAWGLIRASSNKPSLVVVIESFQSMDEVKAIFKYINEILDATGKVGEYDQTI
ncbi:MAG: phosphomannomutase/phosphoglucomutase [Candidatus Pelagibacterales bacterium]|jgi:phosphomannomutase/phosphoglucomutase|tara:strand:- start:709 stop:2217 length:1509 start_codon:yes stop_codon:yes gene_type:complete